MAKRRTKTTRNSKSQCKRTKRSTQPCATGATSSPLILSRPSNVIAVTAQSGAKFFLLADSETGGIEPQNGSLLTMCFYILDDRLEIVDRLKIALKHDPYILQAAAMRINNIDIVKHDEIAIWPKDATKLIVTFLSKYLPVNLQVQPDVKPDKFTPVGHNVAFDLKFFAYYLPEVNWSACVSYHVIDTATIADFLKLTGKLPADLDTKLVSLALYFGIPHNAHEAEGDVKVTHAVLLRFIALVRGDTPSAAQPPCSASPVASGTTLPNEVPASAPGDAAGALNGDSNGAGSTAQIEPSAQDNDGAPLGWASLRS